MGLLLHQFRKDLRQTWIVWLLWLLVTGLQFALAAGNVGASDAAGFNVYSQLLGLVPMIHNLLLFVLVPLLLLQEPTVGTTAFWLTKPMPRGVVLGSKLLALLILVVVPLLGKCAVFASHGLMPGDVVLAGLQVGLHELGWIALITALASLSPSFAWYLAAAVGFLALQFLSGWAAGWVTMLAARRHAAPVLDPEGGMSLWQSRAVVGDLLRIGCALAVAVLQYLTRRTRVSIAVAAAGLVLAFLAGRFWPWNFLARSAGKPAPPAFDVSKVTVEPGRFHNVYEQPDWRGGPPRKTMNFSVNVKGIDPAYEIRVANDGGELALPGGKTVPLASEAMGYVTGGQPGAPAIEAAIGDLPILAQNPLGTMASTFTLFALDAPTYTQNASTPGTATVRLRLQAMGCRIAAELPLAKGSSFRNGSERTTVADVLRNPDGVDIVLRHRTVQLQLRPLAFWNAYNPTVVLVNRKRGEAVIGQNANRYASSGPGFQGALFAGALGLLGGGEDRIESVNEVRLFFGPPQNWSQAPVLPVPLDDAWLADASLAVLEQVPAGEFPATLTISGFSLDGKGLPDDARDGRSATPDKAALSALSLPENPTRADVWRYVVRISGISQRQQGYSPDDPQVQMLRRVGVGHAADLLIASSTLQNPYYFVEALKGMDLSGRGDLRDMTLRLLKQQPDLIELVTRNHWEKEAEPVLLARIRDAKSNDYLNERWILALASLRDPASYDVLLAAVESRSGDLRRASSIDLVRALPGPLVAGMVERLWQRFLGTKDERQFLGTAASWGIVGALDRAAEILAQPADTGDKEKTELRDAARNALRATTACPDRLLDADLAAWYLAGKSQTGFDPGLGRFVLHPLVPPPDQGWPKPDDAMKALGWRAAGYDTGAIDAIDDALGRLAEGLDPKRDEGRINSLRQAAWGAFNIVRDAAADDPAVLKVLGYAQGKERLRNFVAWGYGKAAAAGDAEALDALTHYQDRGWTFFNAMNSLADAVRKNQPQAVDFVLATYADPATASMPEPKAVRNKLVSMIQDAANAGSEKAKAVYETIQK